MLRQCHIMSRLYATSNFVVSSSYFRKSSNRLQHKEDDTTICRRERSKISKMTNSLIILYFV